jgi:hypothetical protein
MTDDSNHPADQLARVREQIKALTEEEKELKAAVLALPEDDRVGRWNEAKVRQQTTNRVDTKAIGEVMGNEWLDQYKIEGSSTVITVHSLE